MLFVSFGSGGALSFDQTKELALGLEMSGLRFLWVVRSPNDKEACASYFGVKGSQQEPLDFLPDGFLERTKGEGHVVPLWVPQIEVLSHGSTGGFLWHCGWNSTQESMVHGVPMIALPLHAEQRTNALILVENLKVAVRLTAGERGVVKREEIARVVKDLMDGGDEGKRIGTRMMTLKEACINRGGFRTSNLGGLH
ncbi:hydroquinone glucosyltransferase-like protein [Cinnamomum micranthum f. kanehirae]|uniref:Hydroquinone glucosyltransferase-like protein n=1 Tax=Cinnamomum micranthum f. kanehirae TaxID=337451 RepID=A0A3S4NKJ6_9MAGN|nr:hydroquinone glucosyltransferase-like protein [Cinnamomum micranthum f. kanehirae]